ncbi:hypothetical protein TDCHD05_170007 [Tenacibaculum dicentrarchi]|nr:hypothetical protein TDCHD05_170007 [Tenacibaculum dicentrarchi]
MIKEIIEKYGVFSDSWVSEIVILDDEIHFLITCANKLNDYNYEIIKIICKKIKFFYIEKKHFKIEHGIKDALLMIDVDDLITFDLDPLDYYDYLKEDPNSTFKIKCKYINYEFIEEYIDK